MTILPFVLLAGTLLFNQPSLAQTEPAPAQPLSPSPAAPTAPVSGAGSSGTNLATGGTAATPAPPTIRKITVASLTTKDLRGQDDSTLGDIAQVVESTADKKPYVVVSRGGILGFFEEQYLVPVDQIAVAGDRVVAKNMTQAEIESSPKFIDDVEAYRPLETTQVLSVSEQR